MCTLHSHQATTHFLNVKLHDGFNSREEDYVAKWRGQLDMIRGTKHFDMFHFPGHQPSATVPTQQRLFYDTDPEKLAEAAATRAIPFSQAICRECELKFSSSCGDIVAQKVTR